MKLINEILDVCNVHQGSDIWPNINGPKQPEHVANKLYCRTEMQHHGVSCALSIPIVGDVGDPSTIRECLQHSEKLRNGVVELLPEEKYALDYV